jgi:hypothetical protein
MVRRRSTTRFRKGLPGQGLIVSSTLMLPERCGGQTGGKIVKCPRGACARIISLHVCPIHHEMPVSRGRHGRRSPSCPRAQKESLEQASVRAAYASGPTTSEASPGPCIWMTADPARAWPGGPPPCSSALLNASSGGRVRSYCSLCFTTADGGPQHAGAAVGLVKLPARTHLVAGGRSASMASASLALPEPPRPDHPN